MRILVISNYYPPLEIGGWEQLTRDVGDLLLKRGHQLHILTSNYRTNKLTHIEQHVSRVLNMESPDHIHYQPWYVACHRKWEKENIDILSTTVGHFDPDVIFINGMWNLPSSLARHAENILPGRVVYYMASLWPTELDAHLAYWKDHNSGKPTAILKRLIGQVVSRTLCNRTSRSQLDFSRVLCVSAYIRDVLIRDADIAPEKLRVVHNGIELDKFTMRNISYQRQELKLLYAGRLSPDKGVHTAIEGFRIFAQNNPEIKAHLTIAGGGSPDYLRELELLANVNGLTRSISFIGWVERQQMPLIMQQHDVFLFPSIWSEPLARSIQEAMACGLIVIGTTTGGTPEILIDGKNGLTFEANNADMLAEKIQYIAQNQGLRVNIAHEARKTVEERFTLDRMVDELELSFIETIEGIG